jgi:uncharacterized protein (TIGR03435 family)
MRSLLPIIVLMAGQSFGQVATTSPSFEVASVKVVPGSSGIPAKISLSPRRSGGRITWTTTLSSLGPYAYHLPGWRIVGMEKDDSFYEIEATMDPSTTEDQVRLMFQKLLADRFKLVTHRETKELQGYALVVGKTGPKIKATTSGEAPSMPDYLSGKPSAAFEGRILVSMEGKGASAITGRRVSISQLADMLSETLGVFVVDQTGMTGSYYFGFRFLSVSGPGDSVDAPSIFTALQDELGLKLDKQKGPVEILVVDHLEKPSQN